MRVYHNCYFERSGRHDGALYVVTSANREPEFFDAGTWGSTINGDGTLHSIKTAGAYYYPAPDCKRIQD